MANPQAENGFTRIANEIIDALAQSAPGHGDMRVLLVILRKTYGWNKKEDDLSIGQIVEATNLSRRMVIYCLQNLEAKRMIVITRSRGRGIKNEINRIAFQKNYSLWVVQEKSTQYQNALKHRQLTYRKSTSGVVQEITGSARNGKKVVQEIDKNGRFLAPTKERKTNKRHRAADAAICSFPIIEKTIRRLNELIGASYHPDSRSTCRHINARIEEGFGEADLLAVVEDRCARWLGDPTFRQYLRPSTLFNSEKFEGYLQAACANRSNGVSHEQAMNTNKPHGDLTYAHG